MDLELLALALLVLSALALRPWRLLRGGALLSPFLATLVLLPWLWALPRLHTMPLQLQISGACAVTMMLGWPLAVPTLTLVTLLGSLIAPADTATLVGQALWHGAVPSSLLLLWGAVLRRWWGEHPFIFILGRGFVGTALCTLAGSSLALWAGHELPHITQNLSIIGRWLMAWGDGFMTGMMAAIFVAYKPHWLATWSDELYLKH